MVNSIMKNEDMGPDPYDPVNETFIKLTPEQARYWKNVRREPGWREKRIKLTKWYKEIQVLVADCATREEKIRKYHEYANAKARRCEDLRGLKPLSLDGAEMCLERCTIIPYRARYDFTQNYKGPGLCERTGQAETKPQTQADSD